LNNLKEFERPHSVFKPQIMVYRHPVLYNGLQGTGKSLTAKAIASDWQLPLLNWMLVNYLAVGVRITPSNDL
jgi:SpoVK/Ycf46/Vps4 family AAA+-type ATPase